MSDDDATHQQFVGEDAVAPPLNPGTATAEELVDEETRESYNNLIATQKFIATSEEDQRVLQLQQTEIADLLERVDELGTIEYFKLPYFSDETTKVWRDREAFDRNTAIEDRPNAVRLFPNTETVEKQRRLRERLKEDHALEDREELRRRHPLLFHRVVKDENRRAIFASAMEARRTYQVQMNTTSALPLLLQHEISAHQQQQQLTTAASADSCASTILHATKGSQKAVKAFENLPRYIRSEVQLAVQQHCGSATIGAAEDASGSPPKQQQQQQLPDHEQDWKAAVAEGLAAAEKIVDKVTSLKPRTLTEMLSDQQQQLRDLATREEQQYKPLLEKYFEYQDAVQKKLERLADDPLFGASQRAAA